MDDPDTVRSVLTDADYHDFEFDPVTVELTVGGTAEETAGYVADTGRGRLVLESVADDQLDDALDAVRTAFRAHASDALAAAVTAGTSLPVTDSTHVVMMS